MDVRFLAMLIYLATTCNALDIRIGAVLSHTDKINFLRDYVDKVNNRDDVKDKQLRFDTVSYIMDTNPIRSAMSICEDVITKGVHVIIASHPPLKAQSPISVSYTCGYYGIPLIGIHARDSAFSDKNVHSTFMRTVPPYFHQASVWIDILLHYDWRQVIFIHGMDEEGRAILSRFQALAEDKDVKGYIVTRKNGPSALWENLQTLSDIKNSTVLPGLTLFSEMIEKIVKFTVGTEDFTDLLSDLPTLQSRIILLSAGQEDAVNLFNSAKDLNLTESPDTEFVWILSEQALNAHNRPLGVVGLFLANGSNEQANIQDSVEVIVRAALSQNITSLANTPLNCSTPIDTEPAWEEGTQFLQEMKSQDFDGLTGRVAFNEEGDRLNAIYYIKNYAQRGKDLTYVGFHGKKLGNTEKLEITTPIVWPNFQTDIPKGIKISTHLQIVTISSKPFVYTSEILDEEDEEKCLTDKERMGSRCTHRDPQTNVTTTHCCWGYCIDMLKYLSKGINFTYDLHLSSDPVYGSFERKENSTKKTWNGMVGELVDETADMIVAPLTINPERAQHIDFSKPFKYQGLTILVKKTQKDSSLASFLQPFQDTLWILVGLSVHVVALVLYLLDRFSPFGRFKLAKNEDTEEDALNLSSAMWFAWGVLLNSGIGEGTPRSFSARVLGMVWAGFAMIIVASYTANLAAFLVLDRPDASISGIDDSRLRNPNENFLYATVKQSAVEMYFKRQVELSTMYRKMEELNYQTAEDAIQDVKSEKLQAFIWDSSRLEYEAANDCDLVTAGELFGRSGLGVGLRKGSPWTHKVSLEILELHEGGEMEKLDNKWILVESTDCPERDHTPATLGLTNMAGVFMMVAGGIVAGVFLIFVEILYKRHRGLKEKELELARNAADRWRGNIAKRRTLRQTLANQRDDQNRVNSLAKISSPSDSNCTVSGPAPSRSSLKQTGSSRPSPPISKPRVTLQTGRGVAPSAPSVMVSNPAFSSANRSDFV